MERYTHPVSLEKGELHLSHSKQDALSDREAYPDAFLTELRRAQVGLKAPKDSLIADSLLAQSSVTLDGCECHWSL